MTTIMSVRGTISDRELGVILPHEHLFPNVQGWEDAFQLPLSRALVDTRVNIETIADIRRRALSCKDNLKVEDTVIVTGEVMAFKDVGGGTIVDLSPRKDLSAAPERQRLKEISEATGVHVIASTGIYVESAHPPEIKDMSVSEIAEFFLRDLETGEGPNGIRPGVIGEIGTSWPVSDEEKKVLAASAKAQQVSGAPLSIHLFPGGGTHWDVCNVLLSHGADPSKTVLGHLDGQDPIPSSEHVRLAAEGFYVEYDVCGAVWTSDDMRELFADQFYWSPPASDQERVNAIKCLLDAGYGDKILLSHDVATKVQLRSYGGSGFVHIPRYMVPFMIANGIDSNIASMIVRENPMNWLN